MEFTINWSPQARDLLRAGKIQVDRFKCPDWTDMIADAREDAPVYVHFPLVIGRDVMAKLNWGAIEAMMADTNTPHVNLHLEPLKSVLGEMGDDDLIEYCIREVAYVVERFGGDTVVLENVPYRRDQTDKFEASIQPQNIAHIIRETGCRLLMDVGHAQISADTFGIDARDYMSALPLERLGEVHVAGVTMFTQTIYDHAAQFEGVSQFFTKFEGQKLFGRLMDHFGMDSEDDWMYFAWVLDKIRDGSAGAPRFVSFEYGGTGIPFGWRSESDVIARDVPRFYEMVHKTIIKT